MRPLSLLGPLLALALCALASGAQERRLRIVDAGTGQPIEGATADRVPESVAPIWGRYWSTASGVSDEKGLVSLPSREPEGRESWLIVRAEGYAPFGNSGLDQASSGVGEIRLWPVAPAQVRVLDYRGRPIPMVHLGVAVGYGTTPDVASAVTDHEGRATLHAVGKEGWDVANVYPVASDVLCHELAINWKKAIKGPLDVMAAPGSTLHGRVFGPFGKPAEGLVVGGAETSRGPFAVTDAAGRFRLTGVDPLGADCVVVWGKDQRAAGFFYGAMPGTERILRLPDNWTIEERQGPESTLEFNINVVGYRSEGQALWPGKVPVTLWDPATGWMTRDWVSPGETLSASVVAGRYMVRIGGESSPFSAVTQGPFDLLARETLEISEVLPPIEARRLVLHDIGMAEHLVLVHSDGTQVTIPIQEWLKPGDGRVEGSVTGIIDPFVMPASIPGLWVRTGGEGTDSISFAFDPPPANEIPLEIHARPR